MQPDPQQPETRNPKPETKDPETRNPELETEEPNPQQPETRNPELETEAPYIPIPPKLEDRTIATPHSQEYLDTLYKARELAIRGLDSEEKAVALDYAEQSFAVSKDCAEAYILLGSRKAPTFEEAVACSLQAQEAALRAIGGMEYFKKAAGRFHDSPETLSFLRGLESEANIRWLMKDIEGSVNAYRKMVHLNPADQQNAKHPLSDGLIRLRQYAEIEELMEQYPDEEMSWLNYNYALMVFKKQGPSEKATAALHRAMEINPHTPYYLVGHRRFPTLPPGVDVPGGENGAIVYGMTQIMVWRKTIGALRWVRGQMREKS